jgi:class 3 adenylate cyclase
LRWWTASIKDAVMARLTTGYARTDEGVYLAYQIAGDAPLDLVWQPVWPGNLDMQWEFPVFRTLLDGLASFSRLIQHDHRGVGLSSRNVPIPNLETRLSDLLVVLDHVGVPHPVLAGWGSAGAVHALLAATRPERVASLVWIDPSARYAWAPDHPWGFKQEEIEAELVGLEAWGTERYGEAFADYEELVGLTEVPDADIEMFAKASRNTCTPDIAIELARMWSETDVREVLDAIRVPTLVVSRNQMPYRAEARDVAARVRGAEFLELDEETISEELLERVADGIRRFVRASRPLVDLDTLLSTVLFTDIVGSTESQAKLGDLKWKDLVERHHSLVRDSLGRWGGTENDTAGDGFYATFEGPARAIRCALEISERVRDLGIRVRAGVHTGECRIVDGKIGGIAVSIGARIAATAHPSEVRVSQTVKDLVAGSGLAFEDAGEHELKGVPDRWRLYRVTS